MDWLNSLNEFGHSWNGVIGLCSFGIGVCGVFLSALIVPPTGTSLLVSPKALLKGLLSILLLMAMACVVVGVTIHQAAVKNVNTRDRQLSHERMQLDGSSFGKLGQIDPGPIPEPDLGRDQRISDEYDRIAELVPTEIALALLAGLIYARGAYVAASSAKTSWLMRFLHGIGAVACFEIGFGMILAHSGVELPEPHSPLVEQWTVISAVVGCLFGCTMGAED